MAARLALAAALALVALAAPAAARYLDSPSGTTTIPATGDKIVELNVQGLSTGQTLEYSWGILGPGELRFDIHWHDGTQVRYEEPAAAATGKSGKVAVKNATMSFAWENRGSSTVELRYEVKRAASDSGSFLPAAPLAALAALLAAAFVLGARRP